MKIVEVSLLLGVVQAMQCASYQCEHPGVDMSYSTCVYYEDNTYNLKVCDIGMYCRLEDGMRNSSCFYPPTVLSNPPPVYIGELCTYTNGCIYGNCVDGLCRGSVVGSVCTSNAICDIGLYCSNGHCANLIESGEGGCVKDTDCVNTAGCNVLSGELGVCVDYFSIKEYQPVGTCYGNQNYLCSSSYCTSNSTQAFLCLPDLESSKDLPVPCSSNLDCPSSKTKLGVVYNNCTCGMNPNGTAFCDPFLGDAPGENYLDRLKWWTSSEEIAMCNTDRRFEYSCLVGHMKYEEMNEFGYYSNLANLYAQVQETQNCTWFIYFLTQQQIRYDFVSESSAVVLSLLLSLFTI